MKNFWENFEVFAKCGQKVRVNGATRCPHQAAGLARLAGDTPYEKWVECVYCKTDIYMHLDGCCIYVCFILAAEIKKQKGVRGEK